MFPVLYIDVTRCNNSVLLFRIEFKARTYKVRSMRKNKHVRIFVFLLLRAMH
jgi:hypothetical protein